MALTNEKIDSHFLVLVPWSLLASKRAEMVQISGAKHAIESLGTGGIVFLEFRVPPIAFFEFMPGSRYSSGRDRKVQKGRNNEFLWLVFQ